MPFNASSANVVFNGDYNDYGSSCFIQANERPEGPVQNRSSYVYVPPRPVSPRFTGQQVYLDQLQEFFFPQSPPETNGEHTEPITQRNEARERRWFLLHGKGGVGKTQLSLKFAENNSKRFWRIFWIDASSADTMELSLRSIAEDAEAKAVGVDNSTSSVLQWISRVGPRCLLVYDNADGDPDDIEAHLPTGMGGNILFTSRNPNLARFISHKEAVVEVGDMNEDDATSLLLRWITPDDSTADVERLAMAIVKELCCLPLAVDQAGAAIKSGLCTINTYLLMYLKRRKDLMTLRSFRGASRYGYAVYITWDLSFKVIQAGAKGDCSFISRDAAESAILIIETFAFLHSDNISEEILKRIAESPATLSWSTSDTVVNDSDGGQTRSANGEEFLQRLVGRLLLLDDKEEWDSFPFREGIRILISFSLIKTDTLGQSYSVHPLVHAWSRDRMSDEDREVRCRSASALLAHSIPWGGRAEDHAFRRDLIPHIKSCRAHKAIAFKSEIYAEQEFMNFALAYHENGFYKEAAELRFKVMESKKTVLGVEHPETLMSMGMLVTTYLKQGRYKAAEELQVRVLELEQTLYGPKHSCTLGSMNNLAFIYQFQGRYKEAEELHVQVLKSKQTIHGAEHPDTVTPMNNLAFVYQFQGRYEEAEELQVRVLELHRKIHGAQHPDTLASTGNLALVYQRQGRHKEAEELYTRVLELRQAVLFTDHPDTLTTMQNLASTYWSQGKYKKAEELHRRVLEKRQTVLGVDHSCTLVSMDNLASTLHSQGRHKEAEELYMRALEMRQRVLGAEHPDTLTNMHDLATTYSNQGKYKEAEELQARVMGSLQTKLGVEHPDTLASMVILAVTLKSSGKDDYAIELMLRAVSLQMRVLGSGHPETAVWSRCLNRWIVQRGGES